MGFRAKPSEPDLDYIEFMQKHGLDVSAGSEVADIRGWLHTGNYALNWATSNRFFRGWPLGRSVEIYGDNSTGKSFLILRALASAQDEGGFAFLDDTEAAISMSWAENKLGINPSRLAYADPRSTTVKEHLAKMKSFISAMKALRDKKGIELPTVAALDSLGHLATEAELDKGEKDPKRPQEIHLLHRVIGSEIAELPVVYLVANHKISNWGGMFAKDDSSGGQGTKYASTLRVNLFSPTKLKNEKTGDYNGVIVNIQIEKNRITQPWRKVKIALPWDRPINPFSGLIDLLLARGILKATSGNTLAYEGSDTGIKSHKTNFLKQDESAEELIGKFPNLLEDLDKRFEYEETAAPEGELEVAEEENA